MKHTPGPWTVDDSVPDEAVYVMCPSGTIANVGPCGTPDDEDKANARLIAAAPDLLEALKNTLCYLEADSDDDTEREDYAQANAALAKAKREAP